MRIIDPSVLIEWAVYQRQNRRAQQEYMHIMRQLKTIRQRDQRGRKRPAKKAAAQA